MKEQLISLKTAKLAKKKGFNISTKSFYGCDDPVNGPNNTLITIDLMVEGLIRSQEKTLIYNAPTQAVLQAWLRDKHNINASAYYDVYYDPPKYTWTLYDANNNKQDYNVEDSYEDALEQGLYEALKLIEDK